MITKQYIGCRVGSTNYTYYLHTNKLTTPSICVRYGSNLRYCPLTTGSSKIHVRYGSTNYGAQNWTPRLNFRLIYRTSSAAYAANYSMYIDQVTMSNSVSINKQIQIQARIKAGSGSSYSSWLTLTTLSAGATSASSGSASQTIQSQNAPEYRIVIGGTQVSTGSFATVNNYKTVNYDIPSGYWG